MIRSMLDIIRNSWDRKSIFNLLRTGLTPFSDDEIDILENAVIAGGIRGKTNWHKDWVFTESTSPESINVLRVRLTELIDPVSSVFSSKMSTVREKTTALYELGMTCRVQIKLAEKEEQLIREGKRAAAGEYSQIYKLVMDVYDKLVEIMGDDGISSSDYCDILEAALTEKRIGITPPGIDRVFVGDIVRSRTDSIRIMFFAGVNEGHIGITSNPSGLLTEADRAELLQKGIVLSPTPRQNMYRQRYYLYLALSKPSDRLYLSYSVSGTSGEALKDASLIGSICKLFPSLKIDIPDPMDFCAIEKPADGMRIIPRAIGDGSRTSDRKKYPELFNWYRRNPEYSRFVRMISEMPEKDMGSDSIGKACASALYGKDITGSATGLEQYAKCAFSYFLKYGLELSPRKTHEYKPTDRGMILHKALENYSRSLNSKRIKWQDLPSDKQASLAESCVDEAILSLSNDLLTSDARSKYEISRLKRLMKRTVWAVTKHLEAGDFTPAGFEINFRGNDLASLNKELENGSVIHLRGIIDRIDIYEDESKILTSIIDYKTGSMEFDLVPFYHGIRIQLPLYMNAALEMIEKRFGKKAVPAGMLYYNIDDPMIDYREGIDSAYIESKILSSLRYSGLFSSEKEIREHVSKASGEKGLANVIVQKNSKNAIAGTPEMFECISGYTDHVIRKIGEGITEGRTGIKPYKYKDATGCQYCPYKEVCGFDNTLPGFGCDVFSENTKTVQEKLRKFKNITGELQDEMD
ncbi:MAG: PD-(D/E)XK nuclease family protein [Lachnospiraceae bacterium]